MIFMFAVILMLAVPCTWAGETWFDALLQRKETAETIDPEARTEPATLPDFGTGTYALSGWIRTERDGTLFAKTKAKGKWVRNGKTLFVRGGVVCYDIGWVGCVTGKTHVADGRWHHIVFCGGQPQRIYVDGKLDATGRLDNPADVRESVLKFGHTSRNFPAEADFVGELDDLRLFRRVLSAVEIRDLGAGTGLADTDGLLAHWPFEGDLTDITGGLNHALPVGRPEFARSRLGQALQLTEGNYVTVRCAERIAPDAQLWIDLTAAFADPRSLQEMDWERTDGIWGSDWLEITYSQIAGRYARAIHFPGAAAEQARDMAKAARTVEGVRHLRRLYLEFRRRQHVRDVVKTAGLARLRLSVQQLFPADSLQGEALLGRLAGLSRTAAGWENVPVGEEELEKWRSQTERLRHDALVRLNPLLDFDRLVFVRRHTYSANHYYTEFINSRWTPGGNLCVLDLRDGSVHELVPELTGGVFERFDLSFDATRLVFAWKAGPQQGYRLYEVEIDPDTGRRREGTAVRQVTFPPENEEEIVRSYRVTSLYHHGTDDMQPCYLPDGGIAFISTRCQYGILCDAPDNFTTTVLHRVDADGGNLRKLSNSSVSEASPAMLPDGRVMYTRWEYLDKGAVSVKCLWAMRPDGSGSAEIYGNDISLPPTFIYGRPLPGSASGYVVLGTPHCPQNGVGTVIRLDMTRDMRTRQPMTYMTPNVDIRAEPGFAFRDDPAANWRTDRGGRGPLFKDPYPLSKRYFLVAHKPTGPDWRSPRGYGLCLLDEAGHVAPVHRDPEMSCWLPYPLRPRPRPPAVTGGFNRALAAKGLAACVVSNVYHGMESVKRGEVKHIRILEQIPRPWEARRRWPGDTYDQQHACITKDTHLGLKVLHGVVPVEEDGSAHFLVPANANVTLQALDANYMAVQTERTYVNYMAGETRSCVGCHETQRVAAPTMEYRTAAALTRPPSSPGPQHGEISGKRPIHYASDVQPVWNRHCLRCHSGEEPKRGLDLSGTLTDLFSVSYENLVPERRRKPRRDRGLLGPVIGENHPKTGNVHYLPTRTLGSHASVLVAMLSKGKVQLSDPEQAARAKRLAETHKEVCLTREELVRVTTWIDTNCQYYGAYWGRRNREYRDHPNFRPAPTFANAVSMVSPVPEDRR